MPARQQSEARGDEQQSHADDRAMPTTMPSALRERPVAANQTISASMPSQGSASNSTIAPSLPVPVPMLSSAIASA